jgi:prenyltransferase beta subunit
VNKTPDSCYSFWVGGALALLSAPDSASSNNTAANSSSSSSGDGTNTKRVDYFDEINAQAVKDFLLTKCCCVFEGLAYLQWPLCAL